MSGPDAEVRSAASGASLAGGAGAVRDGVGAAHNLTSLLRSPRVSSRALTRALPALRDGMAHLVAALTDFGAAVSERMVADPAGRAVADSMLSRARRQAEELVRELELARPEHARARLALEARVSRLGTGLDEVLALADLLVAADAPRAAALDLRELLAEHWASTQATPGDAIATSIEVPRKTPLVGDARLIGTLATVAVLRAAGAGAARIAFEHAAPAQPRLVVTGAPGGGGPEALEVRIPRCRMSPEAFDVACAAARLAGLALDQPGPGTVVVLLNL